MRRVGTAGRRLNTVQRWPPATTEQILTQGARSMARPPAATDRALSSMASAHKAPRRRSGRPIAALISAKRPSQHSSACCVLNDNRPSRPNGAALMKSILRNARYGVYCTGSRDTSTQLCRFRHTDNLYQAVVKLELGENQLTLLKGVDELSL